ncbi:hypothetical protein [Thalassobium sp. R2A62]|uniref:hypothetical protein n=1 Tax=Thalassobium sp. R2A62 TaxID=633131 RepID=UPI0001B1D5CC|nr:hypothetical protein [Thalassobium sp. R2A62]EET49561.1 hypothetical protein TR2A62_1763 [Thalassobium sp. R2A62]
MSDPVTNIEIEDVLSSIRRLVSEDDRGDAVEADAQTDDEMVAERFVLTPALRVAEPVEDRDVPVESGAGAGEATEDENDLEDVRETFAEVVTGEPAPQDSVEEAVAETEDVTETADLDLTDAVDAFVAEEAERAADAAVTDISLDEKLAEAAVFVAPREVTDLESKIAELEAAVGESDDDWETEEPADESVTLSQEWEDVETLSDLDVQPLTLETTSTDEASAQGAAVDEDEPDLAAIFGDDSVIDEDMLRDMVSDIVRQELQGVLGERITRNVRKLVRREIQRGLASQEFE